VGSMPGKAANTITSQGQTKAVRGAGAARHSETDLQDWSGGLGLLDDPELAHMRAASRRWQKKAGASLPGPLRAELNKRDARMTVEVEGSMPVGSDESTGVPDGGALGGDSGVEEDWSDLGPFIEHLAREELETPGGNTFSARLLNAQRFWREEVRPTPVDGVDFPSGGVGQRLLWIDPIKKAPPMYHPNPPASRSLKAVHARMAANLAAPHVRVVEEIPRPAKVNLPSFVIEKGPAGSGKYRFILNGQPLTPYFRRLKFAMQRLKDWLHGAATPIQASWTSRTGFMAWRSKKRIGTTSGSR
jgi:hypothetical protein